MNPRFALEYGHFLDKQLQHALAILGRGAGIVPKRREAGGQFGDAAALLSAVPHAVALAQMLALGGRLLNLLQA